MTSDNRSSSFGPNTAAISLDDANCIVLLLDDKGRILFLNPFGLNFFGFSQSELYGAHAVGTIFPETDNAGNNLAAMIDDILRHPEKHPHQINENRRKNGQHVWVVWSNRAYRDKSGNLTRILCVGNDITDRKAVETVLEERKSQLSATIQEQNDRLQQANDQLRQEMAEKEKTQQALKESLERYRLLSQAPTEGILFHDGGTIIEVNDAFAHLVECPRDDLLQTNIIDQFIIPEERERVRQQLSDDSDQGYEATIRAATGRTFPAELRTHPGQLAGRPCQVVTIRDITERKKTEQKLIQSQKMEAVGTLAGGIAHDFNNMLAGIQGNVELIRHHINPRSPHSKRLSIITQIVERGAKLTGQLLGYARGGQTELHEINLNGLVKNTLDMFGRAHRQIIIETRLNPSTPKVHGDRTQIEQVLLNLMINAVHAMPDGGHLFIETSSTVLSENENHVYEVVPGRYAMLSVQDTGQGMDRETQKHIFDPFFTTKERGQGTGLGLSSTYGIVKNHKGYIEVYSELGVGSQFNVLLPVSGNGDMVETPMATIAEKGDETILMIDDEPDFLDVGCEMLKMLGYTVLAATDSQEALKRFSAKAGQVHLVIIDMVMPGPPVTETIRSLREMDPNIRILLSSGYSQDGDAVRQPLQICNGFIQKPFHMVSLSQKIREILGDKDDENP